MLHKYLTALTLIVVFASSSLLAQGLTTTASKDDWEEINFEFNSSILSDGYPSLLRLADLLSQHPDYKVRVEGHTDYVGSLQYNDKLALARAETVKSFLLKYGAKPGQIETDGRGKRNPEVDNQSKEGRFMNRRVALTVTDGAGKVVSAGGVGDAVKAITEADAKQLNCCQDVLSKLDKLDEILALLRGLKDQNDLLKQEVATLKQDSDALKKAQADVQQQVAQLPKPPERDELAGMMEATAQKAIEATRPKRFQLLGLNLGSDTTGNLAVTGKARFFSPFGSSHALQAEAEYMRWADRQEGQFDVGLLSRHGSFQAGLFSSFKRVELREFRAGGTLGQASVAMDYLFSRGRIGVFGTKSFLDDPIIQRVALSRNIFRETYLSVVDQVGGSTQIGLYKDAYLEGNLGALFRQGGSNRPGGMIRFVQPLNPRWAFTLEAGLNETLVGANDSGRVAVGFQFGNWIRPKEFAGLKSPVPMDVPRIRYEMLTRTVRTGNDPPVADAGPDQIGVTAGLIRLDGSGSYDPDGDPITYQWDQVSGPSVSLSGMNTVQASFTAAEGQTYTFRLTVRDDRGGSGQARVTVTAATVVRPQVRILRFVATPAQIKVGEVSTLSWETENATEVTISGIGEVRPNGSTTVSPAQTTTYTLTAKNEFGQVSTTATVQVTAVGPPDASNHPPVADAGPNQTTMNREAQLNGSGSSDPDGDPITYSWRVAGAKPAQIVGANTATPTVKFLQDFGDYVFELTVTDDKGARSTALTTVNFIDP